MNIFESNDCMYSITCVQKLRDDMHIQLADMQNLRVCFYLAKRYPEHLGRNSRMAAAWTTTVPEIAAGRTAATDIDQGLLSFQLHPTGKDGKTLFSAEGHFKHICQMASRSRASTGQKEPSPYLDVEISPDQVSILSPTAKVI